MAGLTGRANSPITPSVRGCLLTDAEAKKVLAIPEPHAFVIRLALGTGMRWGELIRAQRGDLEERGVLLIHHTKSWKLRRVPLPEELLREVKRRVGRLVPFSSSGQFNNAVQRLSGVSGFHVHQLRHVRMSLARARRVSKRPPNDARTQFNRDDPAIRASQR